MSKFRSQDFPDIVIRPSGIWNSRAPFHDYLNLHRLENRTFYLQVLAVEKIKLDGRKLPSASSAPRFFAVKESSLLAGRAYRAYRLSYPRLPDRPPTHPTLGQVLQDLNLLLPAINEHALVSYSSLFEVYVQCWALNYLLSKLENGKSWTREERYLAMSFCPILNNGHIPTVLNIGNAIPFIMDGLTQLPHIHSSREFNTEIESPITQSLNAWKIVLFWRDWRNLVIHRSGIISRQFFDRYSSLYEEYKANFPHLPNLTVGEKLIFYDSVFMSMVTTHYKAAGWMNQQLEIASSGKRGHPYAPNPKPDGNYWKNPPLQSPRLLLDGDHQPSLQWLEDEEFRTKLTTIFVDKA
jgi:hypothetical protein